MNLCGNRIRVISIESQSAAPIHVKAASRELPSDNQPLHGNVETAPPTFPITVNSPKPPIVAAWGVDGVPLKVKSQAITLVPLLIIQSVRFVSVIGLPRMVCLLA